MWQQLKVKKTRSHMYRSGGWVRFIPQLLVVGENKSVAAVVLTTTTVYCLGGGWLLGVHGPRIATNDVSPTSSDFIQI